MLAAVCRRYGPPEVVGVERVDDPEPGRGLVRVRVRAAAVTSTDCRVRAMAFSRAAQVVARPVLGLTGPRKPVLGMAFAGQVETVPAGRSGPEWLVEGVEVFGFDRFRAGAHAQYLCTSAAGVVAPRPAGVSFEQAAALPYGGSLALWFLDRAAVTDGSSPRSADGMRVLIYGASGAVGTAAVQLATAAGAHVTAVCSGPNAALVRGLGAQGVIDYTREELAGQFDVVFVAVGDRAGPPGPAACRRLLAPGGRYLAVDHARPRLTAAHLVRIADLVDRKALLPVVERCYRLEEIVAAHRHVDAGHTRGAVVITLR